MTQYFVLSDTVAVAGNGLDMIGPFDNAFVAAGVQLGSTAAGGRGIVTSGASPDITVLGQVFGLIGVEITGMGNFGTLTIAAGGSVTGSFVAVEISSGSASINTAGFMAGSRGIYSFGDLFLINSGQINGQVDAVFTEGNATIQNSGVITSPGTAVFVGGQGFISNLGLINGGVITGALDDQITDRGTITGDLQVGSGNDLVDLLGGEVLRRIYLSDGDDTLLGGDASDRVEGGLGRDDISLGGGDDRYFALDADGADDVDGGIGSDTYDATALTRGILVNLTTGEARSAGVTDIISTFEKVLGSALNDRLTGDASANVLRGNDGNDRLNGAGGNDLLSGGVGRDTVQGGDGNDRLTGGEGADVLGGGLGDDRLHGSYDVDLMTGGLGSDSFVFEDFDEFLPVSGNGMDRITDFVQGADRIDLSALDALAAAGDQPFTFIGNGTITALGELSFRTTATFISIGLFTPTAFDVIRLDGVFTLTASDFVL